MHVTYIPCHSKAELCSKMQQLSEAPEGEAPSFLEATVYSKETSVIMVGEFDDADTPAKRTKINGVNYFWCVERELDRAGRRLPSHSTLASPPIPQMLFSGPPK
jgi:hypothetical protein